MQKGFSLIELLVVIGIISILSAIAVPNFMAARERARDAARKSDLKAFQSALELYKQDQLTSSYPQQNSTSSYFSLSNVGQCWYNGGGSDFASSCPPDETIYIKKLPQDPASTTASPKFYYYQSDGDQEYSLTACLENKADSEGKVCSTCTVGLCYTVTQP